MTRVATPENENYLLTIAQQGTASHMEQVVGKYQSVQRNIEQQEEGNRAEEDQQKSRELVFYQDSDDMWVIHARLPAEEGSLVVKALEAVAAPVQAEKQAVRKQALEMERNGDVSAEILGESDDRGLEGFPQVRADALVVMADHFLATQCDSGDIQSLKGSDRCQIVLHVDINTLRAPNSEAGADHSLCNLDNKKWISPNTARRLSCDASLVTVLEDDTGKVLNIGRRAHTVPSAIRRALSVRDECCRFPGCCETRYVDAHHIEHWADGGETSLNNLVTLCRFHHRQLHQGSYTISVEQAGAGKEEPLLVFLTSAGKRIKTSFFPRRIQVASAIGGLIPNSTWLGVLKSRHFLGRLLSLSKILWTHSGVISSKLV